MSRIQRFYHRLARHGLVGTVKLVPANLLTAWLRLQPSAIAHRKNERAFDRDLGIDTAGIIPKGALGVDRWSSSADATYYQPVPASEFNQMLDLIPDNLSDLRFIDHGSGKGRALILAALRPFREVIGIEFSQGLHEVAERNIRAIIPRLKCASVKSLLMDVRDYTPSGQAAVYFFNNPFSGRLLEEVVRHIEERHAATGECALILYFVPRHEEVMRTRERWREVARHRGGVLFRLEPSRVVASAERTSGSRC